MMPTTGDLGLFEVKGRSGFFVRLGQRLLGRRPPGIHYGHAFVVISPYTALHSAPGGGAFYEDLGYHVSGEDADGTVFYRVEMTPAQRARFANAAHALREAPYAGARGYLYLLLSYFGLQREWLARRLDADDAYLCSSHVAEIYRRAGLDLFPGRSVHDVTPGCLARLAATDPRFTLLLKES